MEKETLVENFNRVNGLGTVSFCPELITDIIKQVLYSYKEFDYLSHTICPIKNDYYEVSLKIKINGDINFKEIDRLHKDLLLVMKQSLSLTCLVAINIENGK